jgi:hypothetical protein
MTLQLVAVPLARTRRSGRCPIGIGGGPLGSQAVRWEQGMLPPLVAHRRQDVTPFMLSA